MRYISQFANKIEVIISIWKYSAYVLYKEEKSTLYYVYNYIRLLKAENYLHFLYNPKIIIKFHQSWVIINNVKSRVKDNF